MNAEIKKINKFCREYLAVSKWDDYCVNGLQVEGVEKIDKAILGVSISEKLIREAIKRKAKLIMVHHGMFKSDIPAPPVIKGHMRTRLKLLLEYDINLMGFHLPLDAHPIIGNNICILNRLGLKKTAVINSPGYGEIGFVGKTSRSISFSDFVKFVEKTLATKTYCITGKAKQVKSVGIVSGGASPDFAIAAELGADTYICGDIRESVVRAIEEVGINFINAGHYNTEKFGIQNLGALVAKKFNIKAEFVDVPNEI
jgi:dinuclear metal center YbgI/SA1388 family protein